MPDQLWESHGVIKVSSRSIWNITGKILDSSFNIASKIAVWHEDQVKLNINIRWIISEENQNYSVINKEVKWGNQKNRNP